MSEDNTYFIYALELSMDNSSNIEYLISLYRNEENYIFMAMDILTSHKGAVGLRLVMDVMIEYKIAIHSEFIHDIVEMIEEGVYGSLDKDTLIRYYEEYPYIS